MNKAFLVSALVCISSQALAQTAAVPPPTGRAGKEAAATLDATGTLLEKKEQSLNALTVTSHALGDTGAMRVLGKTSDAYAAIGAAVTVADTVVAGVNGDMDGVKENSIGAVGSLSVSGACAMTGVPVHCNAAYGTGKLIGDGINYLPKLIDQNNRTVNEAWTDEVVFPTWNALGCPGSQSLFGVHPRYCGGENSQAAREAARQRHEARSADLQTQQQEYDTQQRALQSQQPTQENSNGLTDSLAAALGAYADYEQQRLLTTPAQSVAPSPQPSPGGCHPGHDEQAHPGGCLDYSRSQ